MTLAPSTLLEERLEFCARHPVGSFSPATRRSLLTTLVRGPDCVLELGDGEGPALLAVLADCADNMADAADLALIGHRPGLASHALAEAALVWGLAQARRGPRSHLEVSGPELGLLSAESLQRSVFKEAFRIVDMERPPGPPPERLRLADLEPSLIPSLHETSARAFASVPGVFISPLSEFTPRMLACPIPPRLVLAGEQVVGFIRVELEPGGTGVVQSLGRHPDYSGLGLGPLLLSEAIHLLTERGAGPIRLEVAAENERALSLYLRAGFSAVRSVSTWRRRLR
jgi:ribosomal protein S18 acetylase RimI-like enzyme